MKPIFLGKIISGNLILDNNDKFRNYLSGLEGKEIELTVEPIRKHRSNNQNAYYWGVVIELLCGHTGYTSNEMHDALRMLFLMDRRINPPRIKSTTSLDTKEFEEYLTNIRQWASLDLGVYIPDPNEIEVQK